MNPVGELFFKEKKKKLLSGFLIFFLLFNPFVGFWFNNRAEASNSLVINENLSAGTLSGVEISASKLKLEYISEPGVNLTYNNTSTGATGTIQEWVVPYAGTYRITSYGAEGGKYSTYVPGKGAKMSGDFYLLAGETIDILVGQKGTDGTYSGGGGGGTFVVKRTGDPLIIAGGGGGVGYSNTRAGVNAVTGTCGTKDAENNGTPGCDGNGGSAGGGTYGGAGGSGLTGNGSDNGTRARGGASFFNGGTGGAAAATYGRVGGFGGGSGSDLGGGAGGGYGGSVGGTDVSSRRCGGGGGGSYNAGTNQDNASGERTGHGMVTIYKEAIEGYVSSGSRTSPVYDISSESPVRESKISWSAQVPGGATLTFQTNLSLNGGSSWQGWQAASNGGAVPGLTSETDVSNARLQVKQTFTAGSTAELEESTIEVDYGGCPSEPVTFAEDTILELDGLDTTVYIGAGSEAGQLIIDGNVLEVECVWPDSFFRLKTYNHRLLQLSTADGPADLSFSSLHVTNGYLSRWTMVNEMAITYTLGISHKLAEHHVTVNGTPISGSPFSGVTGEISFTRVGSGEAEVYVVTQGEITEVYNEYGANVFGWGWSENIGWISFNNDDVSESLAYYNRAMGHLEGWLWTDNIGWISLNCLTDDACDETDPAQQYKVSIDSQGNFSGWAWSDTLGWLSFDRSVVGNPPGGPYQESGAIARYDNSDEKIRGWSRFTVAMEEETGGWDGWIKFRCYEDECSSGWSDTKDGSGGFFVRDDDHLDGWAWGGTVVGWISPWSPSAMHYGLNINPETYKLSGHIWSEYIGWITFNREVAGTAPPENDVCPDESCLGLLNIETYELNGWARAVNNGNGWDGWIKLNGVADGTPYAPSLNIGTKHFHDWAYGGEVLGWISFNSTNEEGGPEYYVYTTLEFGLKAVNLDKEWDYCLATRHPLLVWDVQGGEQDGYLVEIYGDSGLSDLVYQYEAESITSSHRPNINAGECNVGGNGFQNEGTCNLEYTKQYWWRAKVRPAGGQFGAWSGTATFTVEHTHHWPDPDFSYNPEQVSLETKTYFDSTNSDAFGGTSINAWRWSADNVLYRYEDETSGSSQNPVIVFEQEAIYNATLEVWDSAGYGPCPLSKNINVAERSAYKWIEISPTE